MKGFFLRLHEPRRAWSDRVHPERRASFRNATHHNIIRLGWWRGADFQETLGWIVNLSGHGALLCVDRLPPPGLNVALRVELPTPSAWFQAQVARVVGDRQIGIHFSNGCPYELYRAVVEGIKLAGRNPPPNPEHFGSRTWR